MSGHPYDIQTWQPTTETSPYRLWVNADRTVMMEMWPDGTVVVATRNHPSEIWSPPITLAEEEVH